MGLPLKRGRTIAESVQDAAVEPLEIMYFFCKKGFEVGQLFDHTNDLHAEALFCFGVLPARNKNEAIVYGLRHLSRPPLGVFLTRSTWIAAWFPPAQLGFIAAASASAKTPSGSGGELTHP